MTPDPPKTALDALIARHPETDAAVVAEARRLAEMFRKLGLLSTEPTEVYRPFSRGLRTVPKPTNGWAQPTGIQFTKTT